MPPFDSILFEAFEIPPASESDTGDSQVAAALDAAAVKLGAGVAASTDGAGRLLVELGANDPHLLDTVAAEVREAIGGSLTGGLRVTGNGIAKL
jgi:hypothetical protein